MKPSLKILIPLVAVSSGLLAADLQMPPSPPILKESQPIAQKAKTSPCDEVPPMLILLPPGLQDAVDACQNEKSTPKSDTVEAAINKKFAKKESLKVISVAPAKGFVKTYLIEAKTAKTNKTKAYICNYTVDECFELLK